MKKERVLLVDDDPTFLEIMTHVLRAESRELITAADGEEALAEARGKTPDLIILDIKMPKMNGFTLIRHLRSEPSFALVPVIFLTELSGVNDRLKGFHLGADDYLSKRILPAELAARVRNALRRRSHLAEALERQARQHDGAVLRGALDQIGLPSLLTILEMERKCGTLLVQREISEQTARLSLRDGRVLAARIGGKESLGTIDAVAAVLAWSRGSFEFTAGDVDLEDEVCESTAVLLMMAARLLDETGPSDCA
jgi:CheY-like chemotaxis protein